MILNIVHSLITEKNSNEVRLSGRFGAFVIIVSCCIGLLICSDGRAEDIKCASVTIIKTGETKRDCVDIETREDIDCGKKENSKRCHLEVLEDY